MLQNSCDNVGTGDILHDSFNHREHELRRREAGSDAAALDIEDDADVVFGFMYKIFQLYCQRMLSAVAVRNHVELVEAVGCCLQSQRTSGVFKENSRRAVGIFV